MFTERHRFAALVLVPDDLLDQVIGSERLAPCHLAEIHVRKLRGAVLPRLRAVPLFNLLLYV